MNSCQSKGLKNPLILVFSLFFVLFLALSANAHMLWLETSPKSPESGDTVYIQAGWGHKYPVDQQIKPVMLKEVFVLGPDGKRQEVDKIFPSFYKFVPGANGYYQIVASLKPGFVSNTPKGHRRGSKKEISNANSCFRYIMNAKTIIQVGEAELKELPSTNLFLELQPKSMPEKVGSELDLLVKFKGGPLSGESVKATYPEYFSKNKKHWAQVEELGEDGMARYKIDQKGQWLFFLRHSIPYPEPEVCDEYSYTSTLTLDFER